MRSDVAIPRNCAPEEGRSRRLRSREAPIRENGGTFLPTTRPDDLSQHDRRHRLQRAPSDKGLRPTGCLPPLNRPPAAASGPSCDSANTCGVARPDRRRSAPPKDPNAHRKAGLFENGLASHLDHRSRRHLNAAATATDAGQPALGRAATTRGPATPTLSLLGRARIGARPDALAYWWNSDPNPSSQQPVSRYSVADSCAWIPKQRTIHRPLIHGIVHKAAVALT